VVAALEEMMEATGGYVAVTPSLVAMEGLFAGPGAQYVSDEADWALAVAARAPANTRDWRMVGGGSDCRFGVVPGFVQTTLCLSLTNFIGLKRR
jgi:hypothetical protein